MSDKVVDSKVASGKAIMSFIFGVLSVLCMGFLAGVPAIVIGLGEMKAIKEGKSSEAGDSIAKAGCVLGIVGTAVSVAAFIVGLLFFALGISLGAASFIRSIITQIAG